MDESNATARFLLAVLAMLPIVRQPAQKRGAPETFTRSCSWRRSRAHRRFMDGFYCLSLWLSLPLVIWLSSGWIGLLAHWQALAGVACLLEKVKPNPQPALRTILAGNELSGGELSCCLVKNEAH